MLADGSWDVRCPTELKEMFKVRKGYWFKVGKDQAEQIVKILASAYGVQPPAVQIFPPKSAVLPGGRRLNGQYRSRTKTLMMHGRNHIKTIFHEFYHHLDYVTRGKYNSNDNHSGPSSYGWQFADRVLEKLHEQTEKSGE